MICGYSPGTPVPLLGEWLDALQCRWKMTAQKPFDVSFTLPDITTR
ncbi:MAG: hypothetical protein H6766_07000 [Candidatus Peribacteria bacterium]|nr:MAG: hypothetical protein H6766_07000 [Candidatus Peribacteria bacterium]